MSFSFRTRLSALPRRAAMLAALLGAALLLRMSIAASLTVDTTADTVDGNTSSIAALLASKGADGKISLREAITAANNDSASGPHTITLGAGTYNLATTVTISAGITLQGASAASTIIKGSQRIFDVTGTAAVAFSALTLSNGYIASGNGAGIRTNTANLSFSNVTLDSNWSNGNGGGVASSGGNITVTSSTITNNGAAGIGGAFYLTGGTLTISGSTVNSSTANGGNGAAVLSSGGSIAIDSTSFASNYASGNGSTVAYTGSGSVTLTTVTVTSQWAGGSASVAYVAGSATGTTVTGGSYSSNGSAGSGGLFNIQSGTLTLSSVTFGSSTSNTHGGVVLHNSSGTLTATDVQFNGSYANGTGGSIMQTAGSQSLTRVTFSGSGSGSTGAAVHYAVNAGTLAMTNVTISGGYASGAGGGLWFGGNASTTGTLTNVTIAGAGSGNLGGGIFRSAGTLSLRNSLIADNSASSGGANCSGTITTLGNNLENANTCGFSAGSDKPSTASGLAALASNGGSTQTRALNAGSAAINAGTSTGAPSTDQRGYARVGATDIGAYEYGGGPTYTISGTVFEDSNYGGGAGRNKATALAGGGSTRPSARVELFSVSGSTATMTTATTTDASGNYSFSGLAAGSYYVRVVSSTVTSARSGYAAGLLAVMTFRASGSSGSAADVTNEVGGATPSATTYFTTSASVGDSVPTSLTTATAEAISLVTIGSANVTGIDFGFNFDTVTNTNNTGQGSLRQAITNANTLTGDTSLTVSGRTAAIEHVIFMISNGSSAAGLRTSNNYFSGGVASITPGASLSISASLVLDAQTQPGFSTRPIIEVIGTGAGSGADGLVLSSGTSTVRGLIVNRWPDRGFSLSGGSNHVVQGNWVGLSNAGTAASANGGTGIYINSGVTGVLIGGTASNSGNVISGNGDAGIWTYANTTTIQGNTIGLNVAGTAKVANGNDGVILNACTGAVVGGTSAAARNVISGNDNVGNNSDGIWITGGGNHTIQGNYLGTNAAGTAGIGNYHGGVTIYGSTNNVIGGTAAGAGNLIAFNGQGVIVVVSGGTTTGNRISGNTIHSNTTLGIDLGDDGVTANNGTVSNSLANRGMDAPVFTTATLSGTTLTLAGYVGSAANQSTFASATVEVFIADTTSAGNGEGRTYLGQLTTDASGNLSGTITGVAGITTGTTRITGTATDSSGNTSEFSTNVVVTPAGATISGTVFEDLNYGGGAGRSQATSGGAAVANARVELYDSAGAYSSSTTTNASGAYSFTGLAAGNWFVRVVSSSVLSTRTGSSASLVGVMTYRTTATSGSAVAVTDWVGGTSPTLVDPGNGGSGTAFNTSTYVFSAGLSGTAHAVAPVTLASSAIAGVDFGFNFDTVVNLNNSGQGSLRQAITNANTLGDEASLAVSGRAATLEHVIFMLGNGTSGAGLRSGVNLFSGGVATLAPTSPFPAVSAALVIDARTQPGWTTRPIIELNGTSAGAGARGLQITGGGSTVAGFVINRYNGAAIELSTGGGNTVRANWLGLNAAGTAGSANGSHGVLVTSSSNTIGGTSTADANLITASGGAGVAVTGNVSGNPILGNRIYNNTGLGIDLVANGVTVNDGSKTAGQPNLLMDHPVFTSARLRGTTLTLAGYVGSAANQSTFASSRVEVYASDNDSSGYGEGNTWLGTLTADASGNFSGTLTVTGGALVLGNKLSATATDGSNNTSEFGPQFANLVIDMVVNTTADDADTSAGDGQCLTAAGFCSLRAAITELNAWPSLTTTPTIAFALPGCSAPGQAACSIAVASALPAMARSMLVDGTTQAGWVSGAPLVEINGAATAAGVAGLTVSASNSTLQGLIVNRFGGSGIVLASGTTGHTVSGNFIGTNAAGTAAAGNGSHGIEVRSGTSTIGGTTAATLNVISGNTGSGLYVTGASDVVTGNRIGTNAAGSAAIANGIGIRAAGSSALTIGGTAAGTANVISGNTGAGLYFESSNSSAVVQGNLIGRNAANSGALGNGGNGVMVGSVGPGLASGTIGGTATGAGNTIAHNGDRGITLVGGASTVAILGNAIHSNTSLGIDLGNDGVSANTGTQNTSAPNATMNFPVFTGAGVGSNALTVTGYVGTGTGQALFAGARIELFKAAADASGYGEGGVYLGSLTADGNGRFSGTVAVGAGVLAIGDVVTATATDGSNRTSEFGPNWTSTSIDGMAPAGFNAFDTSTAAGSLTGPITTRVADAAGTIDVIALNTSGNGLHPGFTGAVTLTWVDARNDTGAFTGTCRSSWTDVTSAGAATFTSSSRTTVSVAAPAAGTRVMRLKMTYTTGTGTVITACSNDAFADIPASYTLAATDADSSTAGTTRTLNNLAASGGVVHRAGRPFTVTAQARSATGTLMTAYDGTPALAATDCVLPAGCSTGTFTAAATTASSGVYTHNAVSYAEVGALNVQLTDTTYAAIDAADTVLAARTITSPVLGVGRFVPDQLVLSVSSNGQFNTANGTCLASGSGATFINQGFGWNATPQVTVTARNAAGTTTTYWTGPLMKLTATSGAPTLAASSSGSATVSSSFGTLTLADLGGGQARFTASNLDRFLLGLPDGSVQDSVTPNWTWTLAVTDASEAAVGGNPTLSASANQNPVGWNLGAVFHSGRLALSPGHGDARSGVRQLVQLQRYTSTGWVTMTEDRGCVTVAPANLGVESPSGVFVSNGDCAAPATASVTTEGGRAWIVLPRTPGGAHGRLAMRLAGAAASGHSCSAGGTSQTLTPLAMPWLLGGGSGTGPLALATWGRANRDAVLRRETW